MSDKLKTLSTTVRCDMCHIATIARHFEDFGISSTSVADVIRSSLEMFINILNKKNPEFEVTRTIEAASYLKSRGIMDPFDNKRNNFKSFVKQLAIEEEAFSTSEESVADSINKHLKGRKNKVQKLENIDMSKIPIIDTSED